MSKIFKQIFILFCLIGVLVLPYFVFADTPNVKSVLENLQGNSGYEAATKTSLSGFMGTAVKAFLSLLGIIFVILIILAGYNWMTANGDEEKVKKAQDTIKRAIIGLVIVVSARAIWDFVFFNLLIK